MTVWHEVYRNSAQNAEIAISGAATFFNTATELLEKEKHGSFNTLEIWNGSAVEITLGLDDGSVRKWPLPVSTGITIAPERGIFFHYLTLTNKSGAAVVAAAKVDMSAAIAKVVPGL